MKKKFIIFTLCFTLIFSSLNYKKTYADGGVISLPILATVSALAVGTGIIINNSDDLYDLGRMFYDYVDKHNDLTWSTVQSVFSASVALQPNKLVSVKSDFLDIVKNFFDVTFSSSSDIICYGNLPFSSSDNLSELYDLGVEFTVTGSDFSIGGMTLKRIPGQNRYQIYYGDSPGNYISLIVGKLYSFSCTSVGSSFYLNAIYSDFGNYNLSKTIIASELLSDSFTFPYSGGYTWDNVGSKKENESVALPVPGDLGQLVGQNSKDFWNNTDNLVGDGVISLPYVSNPSIGLDGSTSFPSVDSDVGVVDPSLPNDGIWSTIKEFIISLVVPNDSFWTDTWGGLYNNFTDSFPAVDMSGFNDLVTGEKKFPNIDINVMGVTGRVVNGDVINSIVDWLRPIIAGFMMICLMLFNYRKIYKLIRNTEPFGGIAAGTSDFRTGISEYKHDYITPTGLSMPYEDYLEHAKTQRKWEMANPGQDYGKAGFTKVY